MEDGSSLRDHLMSAERQVPGATRGVLRRVPIPPAMELLWHWYMDLSTARQFGMGGPLPLPYGEILAWSTLNGITLEPWQIRAIRLLDLNHCRCMGAKGDEITLDELLNDD